MLAKGERLTELLKQDQYQPLAMEKQVILIYAGTNGYLDRYPVNACRRYERELNTFLDTRHPELLRELAQKKDLKGGLEETLKAALAEFADLFQAETAAA